MSLALLEQARAQFVARALPTPPALRRAIRLLSRAPERAHLRIEEALRVRYPALDGLVDRGACGLLGDTYPRAPRAWQARLVLGERPTRVLAGLTAQEAHACLLSGATDPAEWLVRQRCPDLDVRPRSVAVARWIVACWTDPARRDALERQHVERGPHGEQIAGRLVERLDEISAQDLDHGPATGVRAAFERAARRRYAAWEADAAKSHTPLASLPSWWRPVRCARALMSAAELVREGRDMRHCVGTYAGYVRTRKSVIVSLAVRGRGGALYRSTAEIDRQTREVRQHRGAGNEEPPALCVAALAVCLRRWADRRPEERPK